MSTRPLLTLPPERTEVYSGRDEWLAARRRVPHSVGASVAGHMLRRPWEALERLTGTAPAPDEATQRAYDRGHRFEPVVLREYEHARGWATFGIGAAIGSPGALVICRHPDLPWLAASPDGACLGDDTPGLVEAKTAGSDDLWADSDAEIRVAEDYAGQAPQPYMVQAMVQLACTGLPWCDLACLLPRYELRIVRVWRDLDAEAALLDALTEWRERHLVRGEPLPTDGSDACTRGLTRRYPGLAGDKTIRPATEEEAALVRTYADARARAKAADAEAAEARNALAALVGDTYGVRVDGGRALLIATRGRETLSLADVAKDPELAARVAPYVRRGQDYRQLRLYGLTPTPTTEQE